MQNLEDIVGGAIAEFEGPPDPAALENSKARYLGKAGELTSLLKGLGALPAEERKAAGASITVAKASLEAALDARRVALADSKMQSRLAEEALDVTLPGRGRKP